MNRSIFVRLLPLLLVVVVAAVFWRGLDGGFIFDDYANIVENTGVHAMHLDAASIRKAASAYSIGDYGRPVATVSFAIDHVIGGLEPRGYKISSLMVHLLNALLVFALMRVLLVRYAFTPERAAGASSTAFAIALLWAVHPLQVSAVLYVVQRMETLSLTFVLLALLAYLKGRHAQVDGKAGWHWLLACLPLVALGLLSKETAILFPPYALGLELTVLRFAAQSPRTTRLWQWAYGVACALAVMVFTLYVVPRFANAGAYFIRDYSALDRVLTQGRVLALYLGQMLLPLPGSLAFYYDNFTPSRGLLDPASTLFAIAGLAALILAALLLRRRAPLFSLGILWFFAAHLLTSNVIPLELVFEHRNYFALLGILLAAADLIRRIPLKDGPGLKYVAVGAVIVVFAFLGAIRSATWGDRLLLASTNAQVNPGSARASSDLAAIYLEMADGNPNSPFQDFAMREFERGSLLPQASIISDQGLLLTAAAAGRPIDEAWWRRLHDKLRHGVIRPETTTALFGLLQNRVKGVPLDDDKLTTAFEILFDRATLPPDSYAEFGDYLLTFPKNEALADKMFIKAIEESKGHPGYAASIVAKLDELGYPRQAALARARAKQLGLIN